MKDTRELYKDALAKWGLPAQRRMSIEECSELIKAICKLERAFENGLIPTRPLIDEMIEELVDVSLMVEQLKLIYDHDGFFEAIRKQKLGRLEKLLYPTIEGGE